MLLCAWLGPQFLVHSFVMRISIRDLMTQSGVAFGTSGARGLATAMTDRVCFAYAQGFLQYLEAIGELKRRSGEVAVAGDFRPSTDRVIEAVCRAAEDLGYRATNCGKIPSPAVALYGFARKIPSIMVTGSHIPDDRNGIKFNKCAGEVLKSDEAGMAAQVVDLDGTKFDAQWWFTEKAPQPRTVSPEAGRAYVRRYLDVFPEDALANQRVGVYQHSAVGRDVLVEILRGLGAEAVPLGRSEKFIPVDTEAIRPEDVQLAIQWASESRFNAIVSADGDSDRPLISDEHGRWLRGDVAGILCAKFLGADSVSTPVSCNTAVEKGGWFKEVHRTRIGSPYVVASMNEATARGAKCVVGYEANGGFLINSDGVFNGRTLRALPTRDAVIVMLGILMLAERQGKSLSQLATELPARFTASDRLREFPTERSREILARFSGSDESANRAALENIFSGLSGAVKEINRTDGVRVMFSNEEIIHLRPSGNAPEFRCYTEAASEARAQSLNAAALAILKNLAG
jgi:phosphomannomutase